MAGYFADPRRAHTAHLVLANASSRRRAQIDSGRLLTGGGAILF